MSKQEVAGTAIEQWELLLLFAPIIGGCFGIVLVLALAAFGGHSAWVLALLPLGSAIALMDPQLTLPLGLAVGAAILFGSALQALAYLGAAAERTVSWRKQSDPFVIAVDPSDRGLRSAENRG